MKRDLEVLVLVGSLMMVSLFLSGGQCFQNIELHKHAKHDGRCLLRQVTKDLTVPMPLQAGCSTPRNAILSGATYYTCENIACQNSDNPNSLKKTTMNCCIPVPKASGQTADGILIDPYKWSVISFENAAISGGCYSQGENPVTDVPVVNTTACQCLFLDYIT